MGAHESQDQLQFKSRAGCFKVEKAADQDLYQHPNYSTKTQSYNFEKIFLLKSSGNAGKSIS